MSCRQDLPGVGFLKLCFTRYLKTPLQKPYTCPHRRVRRTTMCRVKVCAKHKRANEYLLKKTDRKNPGENR